MSAATIKAFGPPPVEPDKFFHDPIAYLRKIHATYGRISAFANGLKSMVFAFGPEYNQHLLSKPEIFYSNFFTMPGPRGGAGRRLGLGLISMNGDQHKRHRRLVMPSFQKKSVEGYRDAIVATIDQILHGWRNGEVRDVSQDMAKMALRITSKVLFGFENADSACALGEMMDEGLERSTALGMAGMLPVEGAAEAYHYLVGFGERLEQRVLALIESKRSNAQTGNDVLSLLIRMNDEDGTRMSDAELVGQASMLFGAANRTTWSALTWTLFLLAQHPSIMADLHDEMAGALQGDAPTPAQLGQMPLLDRVVKESMRLLPPVAFNTRTNVEPYDLGPCHLPKNSMVVFSHYITHHMPELFAQPERFLPDRWLTLSPSPYAYLPFSAGARMCIGAYLATMTLKIALSMILQRHRLQVVPNTLVNRKVTITLSPEQDLPMLIWPQDRQFESSVIRGNIHEMVTFDEPTTRTVRRAA